MLRKCSYGLLATLLILGMLSCGTQNVGDVDNPERATSHFALNVWDESYFNGSSVDSYTITTRDYGQDIVVNINAQGAQDLKALYFDLTYDPETYRPLVVEPSELMGPKDNLLRLRVVEERGTLYYGQILANPEWWTGMTGDGTVAQVLFRKEAALNLRSVSEPPDSDGSRATLVWDDIGGELTWYYYNQGDYDQNGEVNIADLTPLGANFGATGPFDPTGALSAIDGDSNGELNIADITPIGANFRNSAVGGYNVYENTDIANYPTSNAAASAIAALDTVAFGDATGNAGTDRLAFAYTVASPVADAWYWVRPVDGEGAEGTPSTPAGGVDRPVLSLVTAATGGTGTDTSPYQVNDTTDYVFSLIDPNDGDVSTNANTVYIVNPVAAAEGGTIPTATATLNVTDGYSATFTVSATYNLIPSDPQLIYFTMGGGPSGDLEIYPDSTDTDWPDLTPTGEMADPFVLDESDYNLEYTMAADDDPATAGPSGNAIDVSTLEWAAFPPFIADFETPADAGTFIANQFTNGYVFAEDTSANESNHIYVEIHDLPAT